MLTWKPGGDAELPENQRGDQIAGDHEKDVDTDVSPRAAQTGVVKHHGEHRDGAQTVDVRTIGGQDGEICSRGSQSVRFPGLFKGKVSKWPRETNPVLSKIKLGGRIIS